MSAVAANCEWIVCVDWRHVAVQYPEVLLAAVFVTAFAESLAFVGIVVPGVALLLVLSGVALWAEIPPWPLVLVAFLGALVGDVLSFWIGAVRKDRLWRSSLLSRYEALRQRGMRFVLRWGIVSVVFGRFVGPFRPLVPVVVGSMGMPLSRFMVIDVFACAVWAPVYVLPGYSLGSLMQALEKLF